MNSHYRRPIYICLYGIPLLILGSVAILGSKSAQAATCSPVTGGANATISTDCTDLVLNGAGAVAINSGVTVSSTVPTVLPDIFSAVDVTASSTSLTNSGTITASESDGFHASGLHVDSGVTLQTLSNIGSGIIQAIETTGGGGIQARGIYNEGTIGTLNNTESARITGTAISAGQEAYGIFNDLEIGTLNNTGSATISATSTGRSAYGINNYDSLLSSITTLNNTGSATISGTTSGTSSAYGISNAGTIGTINNTGSASIAASASGAGAAYGILNDGGTIITINNTGSARIAASASGARDAYGILNDGGGTIITINNTGSARILGTNTGSGNAYGINIDGGSTIGTINNTGSASIAASTSGAGAAFGIYNLDTITTLNNSQGGNGSSAATTALTYGGNLPTNYNIGINSATHYGQLAVTNPVGTITNFGIYGSPFITSRTYVSVLSGTALPTITNTGTYDNMTWALVANGASFDLTFTGASLVGTQQSLVNTASALQSTYALQNSVLANSFSYDCALFGANGVCISAGGRNTAVSAANGLNNTSALLIAAYRLNQNNSRIGVYADQNLSVSNAGSTVNLGNSTPLVGLFGVWSQRANATGAEVKVSAAYGQKNATVNRQIVGLSEAGSGSSNLTSQGAQVMAKYGFAVTGKTIVSPYAGLRYTQNNMGGYTEGASATVTAPLTYSALNTNATTALAGVGASYQPIAQAIVFASAGVESDINTANGTYSGTSSSIAGLTPVNFNPNPVKNRPTATLGAYYDIVKNQRLGITGIYRQESYQSVSTTMVMATYTIGL